MTIVETEDGLHDVELDIREGNIIRVKQGETAFYWDMETARKAAFVLIGMTDDWARQRRHGE